VATVSAKYITASDLNLKIAEDEDMTIISCRSATDYAAGHIPGAINIGIDSLLDNLDKIDPDEPVYVYCYTGHTAAQFASLLNLLGYDAYSLKFGMCSWSSDLEVNMSKCYDSSTVTSYDVE
jgi:rhodanese-related sulfurtransferase